MRTLADLVQSLPGELYDEILDLTLTPDTGRFDNRVEGSSSYLH